MSRISTVADRLDVMPASLPIVCHVFAIAVCRCSGVAVHSRSFNYIIGTHVSNGVGSSVVFEIVDVLGQHVASEQAVS